MNLQSMTHFAGGILTLLIIDQIAFKRLLYMDSTLG